ncbi:dUTP diphosphatase [Magnetospirillum sulfuroxidans]|uniref:Deoxyuridine 5'-triphosphate nucleotidohydrolase n=1 Tax=Magnetospirillum sulfuroxidans TaxID=611300 RepID=A0ABS5IF61_9PROT|nr:dUTP diphosphatase [Magnetospirillum sulfuroxidans]MBR9973035.1 dUTP diphosphatase [Magnetospirillum sulfuroxidans]
MTAKLTVLVQRLPHAEDLPLPRYESANAAGLDLMACIPADIVLAPGQRMRVPTGFAMAIPVGFEAQIRPRSGLAVMHGITVLNAPGTIDADYRGELAVILINHGETGHTITRGMRIAQMVIAPVVQAQLTEVAELSETARGAGGFGSTGLS